MTDHYGTGEESSALVELEQAVAIVVARVSAVQKLFLSLLLKYLLNILRLLAYCIFPAFVTITHL